MGGGVFNWVKKVWIDKKYRNAKNTWKINKIINQIEENNKEQSGNP